jgi:ectoine hydroxylase-related dioxygenase (phytanoyl-CoA dioxygenase family)
MILDYDRMTPFDCQGRIGDVLFCHHRLVHKAGHNETGTLRFAALANLWRTDIFDRMDRPPGDDPREDWSDELRAAT